MKKYFSIIIFLINAFIVFADNNLILAIQKFDHETINSIFSQNIDGNAQFKEKYFNILFTEINKNDKWGFPIIVPMDYENIDFVELTKPVIETYNSLKKIKTPDNEDINFGIEKYFYALSNIERGDEYILSSDLNKRIIDLMLKDTDNIKDTAKLFLYKTLKSMKNIRETGELISKYNNDITPIEIIEKEFNDKINSIKPKDEFETTKEYEARYKREKDSIDKEETDKINIVKIENESKSAKYNLFMQEQINKIFKEANITSENYMLKINLGSYDADKEEYSFNYQISFDNYTKEEQKILRNILFEGFFDKNNMSVFNGVIKAKKDLAIRLKDNFQNEFKVSCEFMINPDDLKIFLNGLKITDVIDAKNNIKLSYECNYPKSYDLFLKDNFVYLDQKRQNVIIDSIKELDISEEFLKKDTVSKESYKLLCDKYNDIILKKLKEQNNFNKTIIDLKQLFEKKYVYENTKKEYINTVKNYTNKMEYSDLYYYITEYDEFMKDFVDPNKIRNVYKKEVEKSIKEFIFNSGDYGFIEDRKDALVSKLGFYVTKTESVQNDYGIGYSYILKGKYSFKGYNFSVQCSLESGDSDNYYYSVIVE